MSIHSSMESGSGANALRLRLGGLEMPLAVREIQVAGVGVPLLEAPYTQASLEAVSGLRGLTERTWPYWLEDWPATYALAEALAESLLAGGTSSLTGPVLDLGCGSGFLAAFFRTRFGLPIFSCDFNADACRLAVLNAAQGPGPAGSRVFCADFNHFPTRRRFGLILCGEMLYARENRAPILAFLGRHLATGGSAWLGDPGRSAAAGFAEEAAAAGFRTERLRARKAGKAPAAGREPGGGNVDVYLLTRPGDHGGDGTGG